MTTKRKILLAAIALLIVPQLFQIDKSRPEVNPAKDIIAILDPPEDIQKILKNACYDCHSYETKYPWYTSVAPISWWIGHHIEEAREELNFSTWADYAPEKADHKLEEIGEEVSEGKMPLDDYVDMHPEAELTKEEREALADWADSMRE
ncbi:MAG: heme-binding domain-containing protein [Flavobacteriales bacterium]|nr:heme-binding domain-containing protein [Flavobacteriales bacterium]